MLSPLSFYVRGARDEKLWVPGWGGLWELAISKPLTSPLKLLSPAMPSAPRPSLVSSAAPRPSSNTRCSRFQSDDDGGRYEAQLSVSLHGFDDNDAKGNQFLIVRAAITLVSRGWFALYCYSALNVEAICALYDKPGPAEMIYGDYDELQAMGSDLAYLNLPQPLQVACITHIQDLCRQLVSPWLEHQYNSHRHSLDHALGLPYDLLTLITSHLLPHLRKQS